MNNNYGFWDVETFTFAEVQKLSPDAACNCGVALREHFDGKGTWRACALALVRVPIKIRTVPQWGGAGGR